MAKRRDPTEERMRLEAREALLAFYRDQLVSHATVLLTLALVTFTALTAWHHLQLHFLKLPTITTAIPLAVWQTCRLVLYSRMASYTIIASPKKIVYRKPEDRLPWTGENAIYEENLLYDYSRRVDDLVKETKLDELRQKPRRLYRCIYFLAQPRPRGEPWQKVAFFAYLSFAVVMLIFEGILEWLTCLNPDSRMLFALIPFLVWLDVCLWSAAIAMRKKPQSETPK